ncbi:hypothetical protein, no similarity [Maudiozyma barnettii]|uniref:C2H2-type domain-containing protein n=1 Tax=Maudiozyma barnettii TaxID=61262 RepID=A0A8H2ZH23_9SACH|nr:hypothetical protein, no similarity [Kazachstania barnettii]CAB4255264.1 hypothetical protein, no similarity [Kazachstania barnettii]CAD1783671.1 hypothetical protein, no similarity [Kazachstania barnettii]
MEFQFDPLSYSSSNESQFLTGFNVELNFKDHFATTPVLPYDDGATNFEPIINNLYDSNLIESMLNTDILFQSNTDNNNNNSDSSNNNIPEETNQNEVYNNIEESSGTIAQKDRVDSEEGDFSVPTSSSLIIQQQNGIKENGETVKYVSEADLIIQAVEEAIQKFDARQASQMAEEGIISQENPAKTVYILNLVNNRGEKVDAKQQKPVCCVDCQRMCQSEAHLDRHTDTVHSEERPWACPECIKRFKRKDHLVKHLRRLHHWNSQQVDCLETPLAVLEKKRKRKEKRIASKRLRIKST